MVYYQNNSTTNIETGTNFDQIGEVSLDDTGSLPFYYFKFRNEELPRNGKDEAACQETDGDCFAFINKYMTMKF